MKKISVVLSMILCVTFVFGGLTVQAAKDKKAPKVVSSSVKNNQKKVSVSKAITVKFSEKIVAGSKFKAISLKKGSEKAAIKVKISKKILKITPKKNLAKGSNYTLQIPAKAVKDKAKNNLKKAFKIKFKTKAASTEGESGNTGVDEPSAEPSAEPTVEPTPEITASPFPTPYWDIEGEAMPKYVGRFSISNPLNNAEASWPGTVIDAWFEGTGISATLESTDAYIEIIVDGVDIGNMAITANSKYELVSGLEPGIHNIKIVKKTEGWNYLKFLGFEVTGGRLLAPEPALERKISFVGDSITCGYGVDAPNQNTPYSVDNANAYATYGATTARNLNADYELIAVSGIGVLALNGIGGIQSVYDKTTLWGAEWDHSKWQPQVIVANICTNDMNTGADFNNGELPSVEKFGTAYMELLTKLRAKNPNAHIICAVGPMVSGDALVRSREGVNYAIQNMADEKITYFEFDEQKSSDGFGADWHPSKKTHEKMATALTAEIQRITGWN